MDCKSNVLSLALGLPVNINTNKNKYVSVRATAYVLICRHKPPKSTHKHKNKRAKEFTFACVCLWPSNACKRVSNVSVSPPSPLPSPVLLTQAHFNLPVRLTRKQPRPPISCLRARPNPRAVTAAPPSESAPRDEPEESRSLPRLFFTRHRKWTRKLPALID